MCSTPGCNIAGPSALTIGGSGTWTVSGTNISSATWAITPTTGVSVPTSGTGTSTGTHTFSTAGTYTITFTTTNNSYPSGCTTPATSTCTYTVTVGSGCVPVTAVNITGATSATQGTSKTYTATVTPSGATAPITYNWVATGGTISSGQGTNSVTVLWTDSYAGTIGVTVTNCSGSTAYYSLSVNICEAITGCSITPETGCINQALPLSVDCLAGTPVSYYWSMPGGTPSTSTSSSPSVTYTSTGAKTVTLTLTNPCGTTSTVTKTVYIGTTPTITSPGLCLSNSQNNVSILASGCSDCTYEWDVPGASPSSGTSNPFVTSLATNAITNYTVTATNSCGMYTSSGTYNVGCVQKPTFRAGYGIYQDLDGATLSANTTYVLGTIDPSCCSQSSPTSFSFSTSGWTYVGRVMSGTCAWGYQYKFTPGTYTVTIIMPTSCGAGYEATTTATFTVN